VALGKGYTNLPKRKKDGKLYIIRDSARKHAEMVDSWRPKYLFTVDRPVTTIA